MARIDPSLYDAKRRILLYGPPKCGKSKNLARVPKGSKMFLVDVDRQLGEFLNLWKEIHGSYANLEIEQISEMKSESDSEARRVMKEVQDAMWNPPDGFDFYVVDTYTKAVTHLTHGVVGRGERKYHQKNNAVLSAWANDLWINFVNIIEEREPDAWIVTVMHEAWKEIEDGSKAKGSQDWKSKEERIEPLCGTSARVMIPANHDFVFHVEKAKREQRIGGKVTLSKGSVYRTEGTGLIMASAIGYSNVLESTEDADLGAIIEKMGLKKAGTGGTSKKTSKKKKTSLRDRYKNK